jgi:hypothetical protein
VGAGILHEELTVYALKGTGIERLAFLVILASRLDRSRIPPIETPKSTETSVAADEAATFLHRDGG